MSFKKLYLKSWLYFTYLLKHGNEIPFNKREATNYLKMVADKGHEKAMNNYANKLDDGDGITINKRESTRYYKMSADK